MADNIITSLFHTNYSNQEKVNAEIIRLVKIRDKYLSEVNDWKDKKAQYPTATTIYLYLTEEMELSDYCAAGIVGNMMVEAGGHSLSINEYVYGDNFYGVCQWSTSYHWEVNGANLQEQLDYLNATIEEEFEYSSVSYTQFINSNSASEASIYFARGYERCVDPYNRQNTAEIAYDYFVE